MYGKGDIMLLYNKFVRSMKADSNNYRRESYMKIEKIYFDMDGVLADFDKGLREICEIEPADQATNSDEYDDMMWCKVREAGHYYDMLKPLEDGMKVFNYLHERYGDKCEILSAIPKPKRGIITAKEDKISWTKRILGDDIKVNIVMREEKKDYVKGPGYVLIDDLEKNINEWNAQGGSGIVFTSYDAVIARIKEFENK